MPTAYCPICSGRVFVDASTELGEILICDECEEDLELVGLDPLELDPAADVSEEQVPDFSVFESEA